MAKNKSLHHITFCVSVQMERFRGDFLRKYTVVRCGDTGLKSCYQPPSDVISCLHDTPASIIGSASKEKTLGQVKIESR